LNYGSSSVSVLRDSLHPGVEERQLLASSHKPQATVVRGVLLLEKGSSTSTSPSRLLDVSGRMVMELHPGANDIRGLAPGVYFLRYEQEKRSVKVVVQR
jgi:hypothetical protein